MKKTDIAMIVLIASVSVLAAYFIAKATPIGNSSEEAVTIKTIDRIETAVTPPDEAVFNSDAINPTVEIYIGDRNDEQ